MRNISRNAAISLLVIVVILAISAWLILVKQMPQGGEGPWGGVDVNVIEKYAADSGREASESLINTDQGDLLLFVFTLGGAVAGFTGGYCWRRLVGEKK